MKQLEDVIGDYNIFLKNILEEIVEAGFNLDDFAQMDHMGYRATSLETYASKKRELESITKPLGEIYINDRPIAVFQLQEPIKYERWRIDAIEVTAPRKGLETLEGLEHVELVLYESCGLSGFLKQYSNKQFDLKAVDRGTNPEAKFILPHYSVKFHLLSLLTSIYLEQKLGMRPLLSDNI